MTTHNTHHDQSDVDPSVVETTPASEVVTDITASLPERDATTAPSSPEQLPVPENTEVQDAPSSQTIESIALSEEVTPFGDLPSSDSLPSQTLETPFSQAEEADTLAEQTVQSPSATTDSVPTEDVTSFPLVAGSVTEDTAPSQDETLVAQSAPEIEAIPEETVLVLNESPLLSAASAPAEPVASLEQTIVESQPLPAQASETSPAVEEPSPAAEEPTFPYASILSFSEPKSEEVRTFSDFIEEFRQAEALQETYVDFSLLTPTVLDIEVPSEIFEGPTHDAIFLPTTSSPELVRAEAEAKQEDAVQNKGVEPTNTPEVRPITEKQEIKPDLISGQLTPTPITRVSPLLRPASRLRIPRHGSRHHREEPVQEPLPAELAATSPAPVEPQKPVEPVVEPTPEEQPRPARRYRFDRPSASASPRAASAPGQSGVVPPIAPQRPEEPREKESTQGRSAALPSFGRPEPSRQEPAARQENLPIEPLSPPVAKNGGNAQAQEQAKPAQEQPETPPSTPETTENGRRRHHQERQPKEQPVANPVQSVPVVAEIVIPALPTQPEPIAPEDLPPLEYSDLQKANPRRRRRHRNVPVSSNAAVQSTPEAPALPPVLPQSNPLPVPAPLANLPLEPAPSRNGDNQFSIVSGYTVSQMNQGNEVTGPFMGPEPSPARGSVVSRDGRTTRAEMQRTTVYPPAVRTTPHEGGPSASSLNHLANVVSQSIQQSIQLQTDRMVTELRRANQAPTSVSVSLPPFPSTERVGVFVDVANLLYSARTLRIAVDFGKLLDFLRGNRRLIRAQAYCPTSPQAGDEQMFLQAVKGLGYRITTKNYKTFSSGAKKADLDLDLCMDVVRLVDGRAVDCIVLVSGDSDFMPMLDYCSDHGVRVEVAAFDEAMSATLRQSCDLFVNLSMLEEIRS